MTRPAPRRRAERPRGKRALPRSGAIPRPRRAAESGRAETITITAAPALVAPDPESTGADRVSGGPRNGTGASGKGRRGRLPLPRRTSRGTGAADGTGDTGRDDNVGGDGSPPVVPLPGTGSLPRPPRALLLVLWWLLLAGALGVLGAAALDIGPALLGGAGAVAVMTLYSWALAARTGGRPLVFALLALVVGAVVLAADRDELRTGAAVMVAALAAVLGVMATVPARRFLVGVRECLVATATAAVGTVAAVGFEPVAAFSRFQYAVTGVALVGGFFLVHRLGAGLHGLGRRGVLVVASGGLTLAVMLLYAELLRRYGTPGFIEGINDGLEWCRDHLYGYPRPIIALLGVPALVWGTHMRARRRQGWWVCAFGVALTAPVACALVNPDVAVGEALATLGYSLVLGLLIGLVIIRVDVLLTGGAPVKLDPSKAGAAARRVVGRRAARDDDESAVRPEPTRTRALL